FLNIVSETLENGGTVVIPSFAVGRTQEILYELDTIKEQKGQSPEFKEKYEELMRAPVYVDSPLAISATEIFKKNEDLFDDETKAIMERGDNPLEFAGLKFTKTADESKALNESNEPSIIISASGMCEVGRIKHHLKHNIWNPNSTILFVGYQAPGTLGRKIVDGAKTVKIFGEEFSVNARVEYIEGYSGHADQEWLLNFVYSFIKKPKHIFLVHGEPNGQLVLKDKIMESTQIPVTIPDYGEKYTLDDNLTMEKQYDDPVDKKYLRLQVLERMETLQEEIEDMKNIVKEDMLQQDRSDEDISKLNEKVKELERKIVEIIENE
ncbi:MAG: MBL fold metallo-hydrolase RNA specificity domain-containing protein, partial [Clostridia bacterium]